MNNAHSINMEFEEGTGYPIKIVDEINGFLISYHKLDFDDQKLAANEIKLLVKRIKEVMKDLNIQAQSFVLELIHDGGRAAACSVNKQRETIHLVLPVSIDKERIIVPSRGIDENYILYHELMHAKDILEFRYHSGGIIDFEKEPENFLNGYAEDLSIEGRLEELGKPHYSREKSIELVYQCFSEMCELSSKGEELMQRFTKKFFAALCNNVWGKELTSCETDEIIQKLSR